MEASMATKARVAAASDSQTQGRSAPMDRRGFLLRGVGTALAIPVLGLAATAAATGGGNQAVVVLVLTGADPETGIGGWVDTVEGGRYDVTDGVVAIPGTVGQHLGATVYRDDGCNQRLTLVFQGDTTLVEVGGC